MTAVLSQSGITEEMMIYFEEDILQLNDVLVIFRSKHKAITGWWNLMTKKFDFKQLVACVKEELITLIDIYITNNLIDPNFLPIGITSKKNNTLYHCNKIKTCIHNNTSLWILSEEHNNSDMNSNTSKIKTCVSNSIASLISYEKIC